MMLKTHVLLQVAFTFCLTYVEIKNFFIVSFSYQSLLYINEIMDTVLNLCHTLC